MLYNILRENQDFVLVSILDGKNTVHYLMCDVCDISNYLQERIGGDETYNFNEYIGYTGGIVVDGRYKDSTAFLIDKCEFSNGEISVYKLKYTDIGQPSSIVVSSTTYESVDERWFGWEVIHIQ